MKSSTATGTIATADVVRGRFAPSPTGPLHFGSLTAALGSSLQARARGGTWSVRIENLDRTREVPGAADRILEDLETLGFEWDGPVVIQSDRLDAYGAALERLRATGRIFECSCSRTDIEEISGADPRYPGTCRGGARHPDLPLASRFRVPSGTIAFTDAIQGPVALDVEVTLGDFIVRRRDGYFAYQLAVVVDDHDLGITEVVRGADLLDNTPRQLLLQQALGFPSPAYAHLPLALDAAGRKLSKSAQAGAIDPARAGILLWQGLHFLRQSPPGDLAGAPIADLWAWAIANWSLEPLLGLRSGPALS